MDRPQSILNPCFGSKKIFRDFDHLKKTFAVTAIPANQPVTFLQLHLRKAARRFSFQILSLAKRQDLEL